MTTPYQDQQLLEFLQASVDVNRITLHTHSLLIMVENVFSFDEDAVTTYTISDELHQSLLPVAQEWERVRNAQRQQLRAELLPDIDIGVQKTDEPDVIVLDERIDDYLVNHLRRRKLRALIS